MDLMLLSLSIKFSSSSSLSGFFSVHLYFALSVSQWPSLLLSGSMVLS